MIVAELVRNKALPLEASPYAPFVWKTKISQYSYASFWTTTFGVPNDSQNVRTNLKQVTQDYLNKYFSASSVADCEAQEKSFYWDGSSQELFVHMDHDFTPSNATMEYGFAFGMCKGDVTYIDDYEYLPIIESIPDATQSEDITDSGGIKLVSGDAVANNSGRYKGELDFLIDEPVYGNDFFIYYYDPKTGTLTHTQCLYVEDYEFSLKETTFKLQDKRKSQDIKIPTATFNATDYPNIDDSDVGNPIPLLYGKIAECKLTAINPNENSESSSTHAKYRLPDGTSNIGAAYVKVDDSWVAATVVSVDYEHELLELSNGRDDSGSSYACKLVGPTGLQWDGHSYPRDIIADLNGRFLGIAYTKSNYNTSEYESELSSTLVAGDIGLLITEQAELYKYIYDVSKSGLQPFRYEFGPDGRITARVLDATRAVSRVLDSCEVLNCDELPVATDSSSIYSSILLEYYKSYVENTYLSINDTTYEESVVSKFRVISELSKETNLVSKSDAQSAASFYAKLFANVQRIATLNLARNLDLKIFEAITAHLQPDDLSTSSRAYFGERYCLVLSINPDSDLGTNEITVLILDTSPSSTAKQTVPTSSYSHTARSIQVVTDKTPPTVPSSVVATDNADSTISVTWGKSTDDQTGVKKYSVYRRQILGGIAQKVSIVAEVADSGIASYEFVDSNCWNSDATKCIYQYQISAIDYRGNESKPSDWTDAVTVTQAIVPGTPTGVSAVAFAAFGNISAFVEVNFTLASDDVSGFIEKSTDAGNTWEVIASAVKGSSWSDKIDSGTESSVVGAYQYRVRGISEYGLYSEYSAVVTPTTTNYGTYVPAAPTVSFAVAKRTATIAITKQANLNNADGWDVQISRDKTTWYAPNLLAVSDASGWYTGNAGDMLTVRDNILTLGYLPIPLSSGLPVAAGQAYYFRVRARCSDPVTTSDWTTSGALTATATLYTDIVAGQIQEASIAASSITLTKFASGLRPILVVSTLPVYPYTSPQAFILGDCVSLTTDGKLYRLTSLTAAGTSGWTSEVPTTDLSGTIGTALIADLAISTAKLADAAIATGKLADDAVTTAKIAALNVTASEIASGAVTTDKLYANAVTTAKLAAGAVTANEIASLTITSNNIAAGAITTDKLYANAVTTAKLAAGAVTADQIAALTITAGKIAASGITADKLYVTARNRINSFVSSSDGVSGWSAGYDISQLLVTVSGMRGLKLARSTCAYVISDGFQVLPDEILSFSCYLQAGNAGGNGSGLYLGLQYGQSFKVYIWSASTQKWLYVYTSTNSYFVDDFEYTTNLAYLKTYILGTTVDISDVPAPSYTVGVFANIYALQLTGSDTSTYIRQGYNNGYDADWWYFLQPQVLLNGGGKLTADNIIANSITAGKLGVTNLDVDGSANILNVNANLLYSGATAGAYSGTVGALACPSIGAYAGKYALNYFDLSSGRFRIGTTTKYIYFDGSDIYFQAVNLRLTTSALESYFDTSGRFQHGYTVSGTTQHGLQWDRWNGSGSYGERISIVGYLDSNLTASTSNADLFKIRMEGNDVIKIDAVGNLTTKAGSYNVTIGSTSYSWGGGTGYPTIFNPSTADMWVMFINPHIPYTITSGMTGAGIRLASDTSASYYWDIGVGKGGVGTDKLAIARNGTALVSVSNVGNLTVSGTLGVTGDLNVGGSLYATSGTYYQFGGANSRVGIGGSPSIVGLTISGDVAIEGDYLSIVSQSYVCGGISFEHTCDAAGGQITCFQICPNYPSYSLQAYGTYILLVTTSGGGGTGTGRVLYLDNGLTLATQVAGTTTILVNVTRSSTSAPWVITYAGYYVDILIIKAG